MRALIRAAALLAVLPSLATAATLTVGPGRVFPTISAAVEVAQDGDIVEVQPGTYTNDFPVVEAKIQIVPAGDGMIRMISTLAALPGQGILTVRDNLYLWQVELAGAKAADGKGAAIRHEAGNLTIFKAYLRDNQVGIRSSDIPGGKLWLERAELLRNGTGLDLGDMERATAKAVWFHDPSGGPHVVSRARITAVRGSRVVGGSASSGTFAIDLPKGGDVFIYNNNILQSAASRYQALVRYGDGSAPYDGSTFDARDGIFQNLGQQAVGVLNRTPIVVQVRRNRIYRVPTLAQGSSLQINNRILTSPEPVSTWQPWR